MPFIKTHGNLHKNVNENMFHSHFYANFPASVTAILVQIFMKFSPKSKNTWNPTAELYRNAYKIPGIMQF